MKRRYAREIGPIPGTSFAVTRKIAGRYRDASRCACPSCQTAFADRGEVLARLKKALKRGLDREPSPRSRKA